MKTIKELLIEKQAKDLELENIRQALLRVELFGFNAQIIEILLDNDFRTYHDKELVKLLLNRDVPLDYSMIETIFKNSGVEHDHDLIMSCNPDTMAQVLKFTSEEIEDYLSIYG